MICSLIYLLHPVNKIYVCARTWPEWNPYFPECLAARCSHVTKFWPVGYVMAGTAGESFQGGTYLLLPFPPSPGWNRNVMWWLLHLGAEITWERKMHKAEQGGKRRLGPLVPADVLTPTRGHLPLDLYWRKKEILVLFVLTFSIPNYYRCF